MKPLDLAALRRPLALGALVLVLAGVLAWLVDRARGAETEGSAQIGAWVRQLKQLDADWNVDVLRARAGLEANGSPLAGPQPLIKSLRARFTDGAASAWGDADARARLRPQLDEIAATLERKSALVDRFMAHQAALRNASSQVPLAGAALAEAARTKIADGRLAADLQNAADVLVGDVMSYLLRSDTRLRARIEDREARLAALIPFLPPDVTAIVEGIRPHVAAVLMQQPSGEELRTQLAALPVAQKLDALVDAYNEETARLLAAQRNATYVLAGFAALLIDLFAFVAWRLVRAQRRAEQAQRALQRAQRDLQETQAALAQAHKASPLGQLMPGVAREIDTPLAYVKGTLGVLATRLARLSELAQRGRTFTAMLAAKEKDPAALNRAYAELQKLAAEAIDQGLVDELKTLLDDGAAGLEQIGEIVAHLKRFGGAGGAVGASSAAYDVQAALDRTLVLVRNLLGHRVRVIKEFQPVPAINGAPAELDQVLLSLVTFSVQAIPAERDGFLTLRTEMDDDKTVRVEIQDNGDGIAGDVLPRLFDPLYAATHGAQATTIGLAAAERFVKAHGGAILVDTELGVGTVFTLLLPVDPAETRAAQPEAADQAS